MDGTSAVYLYVSIECWGAWSVVPGFNPHATSTTMSRDESRCWSQGLSKTSDHTVVTLVLSFELSQPQTRLRLRHVRPRRAQAGPHH